MSFTPPADALILQAFPQIQTLAPLDQGGFKVVYRANIEGKEEAFMLIQIPAALGAPDPRLSNRKSHEGLNRGRGTLSKCRRYHNLLPTFRV